MKKENLGGMKQGNTISRHWSQSITQSLALAEHEIPKLYWIKFSGRYKCDLSFCFMLFGFNSLSSNGR